MALRSDSAGGSESAGATEGAWATEGVAEEAGHDGRLDGEKKRVKGCVRDDAVAFDHIESFNILCVGESGLGKSTFLRDVFAHLDPTKQQDMKRHVAEQAAKVAELDDLIDRNEKEAKQCDDKRALELRQEKKALRGSREEARAALDALRLEKRRQEQAVADLRVEIQALDAKVRELRGARDAEEDDEEAERLGTAVLEQQAELSLKQEQLAAELRRSNLDREGGGGGGGGAAQTRDVSARLIKGMPLFDGARHGLDVTLIDTPGYGDLLVDTLGNSSADKVVEEVERRITAHLRKERASRPDMPLDDEKKFWNELVHLCLFFIAPHRMKRADLELMRRLHALAPLVVVIAKSDTMTKAETLEYKETVRKQLKDYVRTFGFDPKLVKEVEAWHTAQAGEDFAPLYGGSDGQWPWAVMGSDQSRREYVWGTAITNEPHHSEMPALRDLLLRAGGWEQLKRDAALKADAEKLRRAQQRSLHRRWRGLRVPRGLLPLAPPWLLAAALAALAAALVAAACVPALLGGAALASSPPPPNATAGGRAHSKPGAEWVHVAKVNALERQLAVAKDDLAQCTDVRRALDDDLKGLQQRIRVKAGDGWAWW